MLRGLNKRSIAYTSEQAVLNIHRVRIRCFRKSYQYASIPVGLFISCTTSTSALVGERGLGKELEGSEV